MHAEDFSKSHTLLWPHTIRGYVKVEDKSLAAKEQEVYDKEYKVGAYKHNYANNGKLKGILGFFNFACITKGSKIFKRTNKEHDK